MGLLWSKPPGTDYEKILSDLTSRVGEVEGRVTLCRKQQRAISLWILSYGALLYLLFVLWVFVYPRGPAFLPYRPLLDAFGLIIGPLFIYYSRRFLVWLYGRRIAHYDSQLRDYRAQQKLKVEELKRTTAYYKTKGLIERFEVIGDDIGAEEQRPMVEADKSFGHRRTTSSLTLDNGTSVPDVKAPATTTSPPLSASQGRPFSVSPPPPTPPTWLDRLVDAIIGDDRNARYALICQKCFSHNGLARPEDFSTVQYICPNCHHLNLPQQPVIRDACTLETSGRNVINDASLPSLPSSSASSSLSSPTTTMQPTAGSVIANDLTPKQQLVKRKSQRRHRKAVPADDHSASSDD